MLRQSGAEEVSSCCSGPRCWQSWPKLVSGIVLRFDQLSSEPHYPQSASRCHLWSSFGLAVTELLIWQAFERCRVDIRDLFLAGVAMPTREPLFVAKHLCGVATDLALRSVQRLLQVRMATDALVRDDTLSCLHR
jgi:hypothetical protein